MIRYENQEIKFDPGNTIKNFKTWLREPNIKNKWRNLNIAIKMHGIIRILKMINIARQSSYETGMDCDNMRIKSIQLTEIYGGNANIVITVENDGSIQETKPIQVYYIIVDREPNSKACLFMYVGKNFFDIYHRFAETPNLNDDLTTYNYQFEIGRALDACGCGMATEEIWSTNDMQVLIQNMREKGFELIERTELA